MTASALVLVAAGVAPEPALRAARAAHPGAPLAVVAVGATMPAGAGAAPARFLSEYGSLAFAARLDLARQFSQSWYHAGGSDRSCWEGLSTGAVAEVDFFLYFAGLVEDVDVIAGLLGRERPRAVYLCTGEDARYAAVIRLLDPALPLAALGPRPGMARLTRPATWRALLKERCLDRRFSFEAHRLMALIDPRLRAAPGPSGAAAVLFEMVVPSSYDTLLTTYEQLAAESPALLSADPRATLRLLRRGLRPVLLSSGDSPAARRAERAAHRTLRQQWRALDADPPRLELHGRSLWPLARRKARDFFAFQAALIVREHHCLRDLARAHRWAATITSSHLHHFGRLCTVLGAGDGPAAVTLQHGVVGTHTYLPMLATRMAVWGELVKDWFVQRGVPPERLVVTGQPRFERLSAGAGAPPPDAAAPQVVVATQPLGGVFQRAVVVALAEASRALPHVQFVIRPHPDEPQAIYRSQIEALGLERVTVAQGDLRAALSAASAVVVHSSTVGLEALLLARPLVVFNPFGWPEEVPYVSSGAAVEAADGAALARQLAALLASPAARAAALAGASAFVEGYVNFDRRSGERIRALLHDLPTSGEPRAALGGASPPGEL